MTVRAFAVAVFALVSFALFTSSQAAAQGAKAACEADIQKFCAGVPQGGGKIAQCLREHKASASPECQKGMEAAAASMKEVAKDCEDDIHRYCAGVAPGTAKDCLKSNFRSLSRECKRAMFEAKRSM